MRKRRSFRPALSDCLEDRVVPSVATASVSAASQPQTFNYGQVAGLVNQAFNTFRTDYNNQLNTFLNSGTSTALSNLHSFGTQRINQLAQDLQTALSQVPGAAGGLTPFLLASLDGTSGGTLLSTLNGTPGNTGTNGGPSGLFGSIANAAINSTQLAANHVLSAYAWGLGTGQATFGTANPFTGANFTQLAGALNGSFGTFRTDFGSHLAGFVGSTQSASQFQSATSLAGANLVQGLGGAYQGGTGMSTGLSPFVGGQINGSYGGAMLSSISGIPTNTGANGGPDGLFSLAANNALDAAQLAVNNMASVYTWGFNQGQGFAAAAARGSGTPSSSMTTTTATGGTTSGANTSGTTTSRVPTMYGSLGPMTNSHAGTPGITNTGTSGGAAMGGTTTGTTTGTNTGRTGTNTGTTGTNTGSTGTNTGTTGTNTGSTTGGTTTGGTTGRTTTGTTGTSTGSTNNPGNNGTSTGGGTATGTGTTNGTSTGTTTGTGTPTGTMTGGSTGSTNNTGNNGTTTGGGTTTGTTTGGNTGSFSAPNNTGFYNAGPTGGMYNAGPTGGMYNPGPTNGMYTGPTVVTTNGGGTGSTNNTGNTGTTS